MRRLGYILATAVLVGVFVFASLFERRTEGWCDAITGSKKWQTTWPFGITTGTKSETSGLERRLRELGYQWNPAMPACYAAQEMVFKAVSTIGKLTGFTR